MCKKKTAAEEKTPLNYTGVCASVSQHPFHSHSSKFTKLFFKESGTALHLEGTLNVQVTVQSFSYCTRTVKY